MAGMMFLRKEMLIGSAVLWLVVGPVWLLWTVEADESPKLPAAVVERFARESVRQKPQVIKGWQAELKRLKEVLSVSKAGTIDTRQARDVESRGQKRLAVSFRSRDLKNTAVQNAAADVEAMQQKIKSAQDGSLVVAPRLYAPLEIGDLGRFAHAFIKVLQVIDPDETLGELTCHNENGIQQTIPVWIVRAPLDNAVDGKAYKIEGDILYHVTGRKQYTTALGASRTVLLIERLDEAVYMSQLRKAVAAYEAGHP